MADAAEEAAVKSLAETLIANLADLKAILSSNNDKQVLAAAESLEATAVALSNRTLSLVKHVREHAAADVALAEHRREHLKADMLLAQQKLASELKHVREHAAADIQLAEHRLKQSEEERSNMRWDHIRDRNSLQQQTKKQVEGLIAKVDAESAKLKRMEAKAKADALVAKQLLENGEAQQRATRQSLDAELKAQQAEARAKLEHHQVETDHVTQTLTSRLETMTTRLLSAEASSMTCLCTFAQETAMLETEVRQLQQQIADMSAEREASASALAREIDRLRVLIRNVAVPVPSAGAMKLIHLEAFKRGTNAVVLQTMQSSPSFAEATVAKLAAPERHPRAMPSRTTSLSLSRLPPTSKVSRVQLPRPKSGRL